MERNKTTTDDRIVKVPFPVPLIRRIDEAIMAGRGGFQTRAELMREAVENLLNELDFPEAPAERLRTEPTAATPRPFSRNGAASYSALDDVLASVPSWEREELTLADLASTAIEGPESKPFTLTNGVAVTRDEPLLGLHNRDYASVWALYRLARYTSEGPIPFADYLRRTTKAAWYFGAQLQNLEARIQERKLSVLFPTNAAKRPSAERGFQSFAIGSASKPTSDGKVSTFGPLFAWRAIQLAHDNELLVALTDDGWLLLSELQGLSLALPHGRDLTTRFMAFLGERAPGDRWGFDYLLRTVVDGPDREELIEVFRATHPDWTPSTASSVVQGYVARAREWGLVETRLVEGRYWLTDAGRGVLQELN